MVVKFEGLFILTLIQLLIKIDAQQFAPGCSFFNGQCVYNVQLSSQEKCGSGVILNPRALDGGCSCDDVVKVTTDLNSLQTRLNNLKQSMTDFKNKLTNVEPKTDAIQNHVNGENNKYLTLLESLHSKDDLLNRTDKEVTNILKAASSEISMLRQQLKNTTAELASCKISSGTQTTPLTATPPDYTTYHCGFQSSNLCHFTQDTDDDENWVHQKSEIDSTSGPKTDHTYGNSYGYYIAMRTQDTSKYSAAKSYARITSPNFEPAPNYCVRFWYTMYGKDVDTLNVYAKVGNGRGYPVYTVSGNVDQYWHMAQIELGPEYTKQQFQLTFEASYNAYKVHHYVSSHYVYTYYKDEGNVAIDDVYVYNTTCNDLQPYPTHAYTRQDGNSTSYYTFHTTPSDWYTAQDTCRKENAKSSLVVIGDAQEQSFLTNIINTHVDLIIAGQNGFYINGNDVDSENHFKWTDTGYPQSIKYTNFHQGQPNNVGDNQDCLLMEYPAFDYEWGDVACNEKHPFICEIRQ